MTLKRCPFCRSNNISVTYPHKRDGFVTALAYIRCISCFASTANYETAEEAIAAWNRRNGKFNTKTKKMLNSDRCSAVDERGRQCFRHWGHTTEMEPHYFGDK